MGEPTTDEHNFAALLNLWLQREYGMGEGVSTPFAKDDWTLIVKLHAMIESGLNDAIVREINRPKLEDVVARLDTSSAGGKVAFAKALGIIDPNCAAFIQALSFLRNQCVHNIKNFRFNLSEYLSHLENEKRSEIIKPVMKTLPASIQCGDRDFTPKELMASEPRFGLILAAMAVVDSFMIHQHEWRRRDLDQRLRHVQSELFRKREESSPKES